jgi:hypothetical protein
MQQALSLSLLKEFFLMARLSQKFVKNGSYDKVHFYFLTLMGSIPSDFFFFKKNVFFSDIF